MQRGLELRFWRCIEMLDVTIGNHAAAESIHRKISNFQVAASQLIAALQLPQFNPIAGGSCRKRVTGQLAGDENTFEKWLGPGRLVSQVAVQRYVSGRS